MKKFAYISKAGIMHIAEDLDTATKYATKGTTVIPTDIEAKGGYPVSDGEEIIVYGPDEMRIDSKGAKIPVVAKLAELYKDCVGR